MPIYIVTFCTMDQYTDANPFWHTCLLLSTFDDITKKMEVVDNWGYYGLPTTSKNWASPIKLSIGLDVDLYGNHGMLQHEEIRYLDIGRGLHGVTFELTEQKFNELQQRCLQMEKNQDAAIKEFAELHKFSEKKPYRIHKFEHQSALIYNLEQAKAKKENRLSRLNEFKLDISKTANTCKVQSLTLLDGILEPEQVKRLSGTLRSVSRCSGKMENLYLHSCGPLTLHTKRVGDTVKYRDGNDKNVKLYWSIPPQELVAGDIKKPTKKLFHLHADHVDKVKKIVSQLQRLEWLFENATVEKIFFQHKEKLIQIIRNLYEQFSIIEPKPELNTSEKWTNAFSWLMSWPRDENEAALLNKLNKATHFIHQIYQAIKNDTTNEIKNDYNDIIAIAAHLEPDKQIELCKIIEKKYPFTDLRSEVCKIATQLQRIEYVFNKANLNEQYSSYHKKLVEKINHYYEILPSYECFKNKETINQFQTLKEDLLDAKQFINCLYMAVVDNWVEADLDEDIEALAAYLPTDKKKDLCSAMGRSYVEPVYDLEDMPGLFAPKKPLLECKDTGNPAKELKLSS